jgi:hypothetical protein
MNEKQIKRHLEDNGLRVADVAVELQKQFGTINSIQTADTMLRQLIAGHRWYPVYAKWLADNYGVIVEKPEWLKPVRERMRIAA